MRLVRKFFEMVLPGVIKPLHALWNEIIGFLFLAIAVFMIRPTWKAYQKLQAGGDPGEAIVGLIGGAGLLLVGLVFGLHGFWKARRISKN
jgi:hypothetical protein